jgi:energy-coupling factor transport system ATP-binding protein
MNGTIAVEDVSFAYPDGTRALDHVSFDVAAGDRVAIIGQNGSGKSTLVRQLNGLLRPTTGRVLLDGRVAGDRHVAELAATVGLAFQNPDRQIFASSVRREVAFGPRNLGRRGPELDEAVSAALDAVGLADAGDTNPYDLGYSRRKLLAIASILAMRTPVVVLDEPTTGQDARGVERVARIVGDLAAAGRTVIAISHDMRFVAETFARVIVMRAGRIVLDAPPGDVFAEPNWETLASTYLEPPLAARAGARLGLGSTPTERSLVDALAGRNAPASSA